MKRTLAVGGALVAAAVIGIGIVVGMRPTETADPELTVVPKEAPKKPRAPGLNASKLFRAGKINKPGRLQLRPALEELLPAPTGAAPTGNDLLLVTWDTVRADHISSYGYFRETTPTLDALAAQGVRFSQYVVPQPTTLPTHLSMFTGLHPDEHGIIANVTEDNERYVIPEGVQTLAQHLSEAGYRTGGFVSSTPVKTFSGISAGFQSWSEPSGRFRRGELTTQLAIDWLASQPQDRPVFMWVHVFDPHSPYRSPPGYKDLFLDTSVKPMLEARGVAETTMGINARVVAAVGHYDREIRYSDDQLAALLEVWDSRRPSSVVMVAGDHGEGHNQHDMIEHGLPWPEQLKSPLVVRAPKLASGVVHTPTTAQDIVKILGRIGDFPGEDVLAAQSSGLDPFEAPADRQILARISERRMRKLKSRGEFPETWSLTSQTEHFMYRVTGEHSLFDLTSDPHCLEDVAGEHPDRVKALVATVEARRVAHRARAEALGAGETDAIDSTQVEELKALGYME